MDTIMGRLSEIERTAQAIAGHGEQQKSELEAKSQKKRDQFDQDLEKETQRKLKEINDALEAKMEEELATQRHETAEMIEAFHKDYDRNHTVYAREILKHITEGQR